MKILAEVSQKISRAWKNLFVPFHFREEGGRIFRVRFHHRSSIRARRVPQQTIT